MPCTVFPTQQHKGRDLNMLNQAGSQAGLLINLFTILLLFLTKSHPLGVNPQSPTALLPRSTAQEAARSSLHSMAVCSTGLSGSQKLSNRRKPIASGSFPVPVFFSPILREMFFREWPCLHYSLRVCRQNDCACTGQPSRHPTAQNRTPRTPGKPECCPNKCY